MKQNESSKDKQIEELQADLKIAIKGFEIGNEAQEKKMADLQAQSEQNLAKLNQKYIDVISTIKSNHSDEIKTLITQHQDQL